MKSTHWSRGGCPRNTPLVRAFQPALLLLLHLVATPLLDASPHSDPYVAYRTDPFSQERAKPYTKMNLPRNRARDVRSIAHKGDRGEGEEEGGGDPRCPLSFRIGLSSSSSSSGRGGTGDAVLSPAVVYPIHPHSGPGRQILYHAAWQRIDMLNPAPPGAAASSADGARSNAFEGMITDDQFPLLLDSTNLYHAQPIIHDVNGDGVPEVILVDYDGAIYKVGLDYNPIPAGASAAERLQPRKRYYNVAQIPRLYLRKNWVETATNETLKQELRDTHFTDFYHSYFEYGTEWREDYDSKRLDKVVSGNVVEQDLKDTQELKSVKKERRIKAKEEQEAQARAKEEGEIRKEEEIREAEALAEDHLKDEKEAQEKSEKDTKLKKEEDEKVAEAEALARAKEEAEKKAKEGMNIEENGEKKGNDGKGTTQVEDVGGTFEAAQKGRRRLQEVPPPDNPKQAGDPNSERDSNVGDRASELNAEGVDGTGGDGKSERGMGENSSGDGLYSGDGDDIIARNDDFDDYVLARSSGDERRDRIGSSDNVINNGHHMGDDYPHGMIDDVYGHYGGDDIYGHDREPNNFYADENYIRVPPHVLSRPALIEIPKRFKLSSDPEYAKEVYLAIAVSHYFDEDEFSGGLQQFRRFVNRNGGDDTFTKRGHFVASSIHLYNLNDGRFVRQQHLDLSTDFSSPANFSVGTAPIGMDPFNGVTALALASPTVANLEGNASDDERYKIVMGTSMGLLYVLDVNSLSTSAGFPIQFKYPITKRAVVEDVVGDSALEIFAVDEGGNVVCLKADGATVWHRNILEPKWNAKGISEMSLGDVDGDGNPDLVLALRVASEDADKNKTRKSQLIVHALDATTGHDLPRFPIIVESDEFNEGEIYKTVLFGRDPIQPLLVDLHAYQSHWLDRIRMNTTIDREAFRKEVRQKNDLAAAGTVVPFRPHHGGMGMGLHIVQPSGTELNIIEGGTSCIQKINVGEEVGAMVQVDDVHGTETLDLVVTTITGQVLTLEIPDSVPFHPLNVWGSGAVRGGINGHTQGYSASAGVFIHAESRRYRDWLGLYIPVTFEIFDIRPSRGSDSPQRYYVEIRHGTSWERTVFHKYYDKTGVFTAQIFIPYGPGHYTLTLRMTTNSQVYEDTFHLGYNVNYTAGLTWLVLTPLLLAAVPLLLHQRKTSWEDDDYGESSNSGNGFRGLGILGRASFT